MSKREFEVFYLKVRTPCFRALCVTVPNRDEAEELLAEAFSRAFQNWSEIRHHPSPSAWIVRTALNLHRDNWRKSVNARRHLVAVPDKYEDQTSMVDPVLLRHMRNLPEQQLLVVIHRVLLDLSTEQTAKALGIAEGTVSTHLKRGLANLREVLETHKVMEALNE
jgi:RNA polymerase sigma-70 factor (ECF subfamily)